MSESFSLKLGIQTPPSVSRDSFTYEDIYGDGNITAFRMEYEYFLTEGAGRIGLIGGLG